MFILKIKVIFTLGKKGYPYHEKDNALSAHNTVPVIFLNVFCALFNMLPPYYVGTTIIVMPIGTSRNVKYLPIWSLLISYCSLQKDKINHW